MNYLESRLHLLTTLCQEKAKKHPEATVRYLDAVQALNHSAEAPFCQCVRDFHLSPFEADVLFFALAPTLDAGFRQKIADIHRNFALTQTDVGLALDLFSRDFEAKVQNRRAFLPNGTLLSQHLCELVPKLGAESQLQDMTIVLPSRMVSHLLGLEA